MTCPHGIEGGFLCKDCRKDEETRVKTGIRDGSLVFGVFKWTCENRYPVTAALRTFKVRAAAERWAEQHECVVRTVHTGKVG